MTTDRGMVPVLWKSPWLSFSEGVTTASLDGTQKESAVWPGPLADGRLYGWQDGRGASTHAGPWPWGNDRDSTLRSM